MGAFFFLFACALFFLVFTSVLFCMFFVETGGRRSCLTDCQGKAKYIKHRSLVVPIPSKKAKLNKRVAQPRKGNLYIYIYIYIHTYGARRRRILARAELSPNVAANCVAPRIPSYTE